MCDRPAELFDATEAVRKSPVGHPADGRMVRGGDLTDILTGNATDKVREKVHDSLPTFAVGRDLSKSAWGAVSGR